MRTLYAPLQPYQVEQLDVGDGHVLHVEQCGRPDGIPVLFLHGGPGSGCKADHRQFFDPALYRIFLVDQRGAGRSTPFGGVATNTTRHLIDDLERIRSRHAIDRWLLFGGSWGAALALAYAEDCPDRVSGMILRGTFLARRRDVDWFFSNGANRLLPLEWDRFMSDLQAPPGADLGQFMYDGILAEDQPVVERIARAWEAWSGAVVMYSIDSAPSVAAAGPLELAIGKARMEMHYAQHGYFLEENQLLDRAHRLPRVPTIIVHGARDITCPSESAWIMHRALPHSRLQILRTAGHLSSEGPMVDALVRATDELARQLS
ncbi:MAG: prolyl aminopeptidase [Gammaproteobacteria bacterium]